MITYVKSKEAKDRLGVSDNTLRHWADTGEINYIRVGDKGNRLYDIEGFIKSRSESRSETRTDPKVKEERQEPKTGTSYIYCRVSSPSQKEDLERQISYLRDKYPSYEVITDIASGVNFKRKGLNKILANSMQGLVKEVVVTHRDRLCRIAFEHFNWLFKQCGVNLIIEDKQELSPESEFNEDLFAIIHVFSARHYGLRRGYTKREAEKDKAKNITKTGEHVTQ